MDQFQQKTSVMFTRMCLENAFDRGDEEEAAAMSRRLDEITLLHMASCGEEKEEKTEYR